MKINNQQFHTIWVKEDDTSIIQMIDQRLLPFSFEVFEMKTVEDAYHAIKEMVVRGAPLIGVAGAYAIYLSVLNNGDLKKDAAYIKSSRPTAVNLAFAVDKMVEIIEDGDGNKGDLALETANSIKQDEIDACYEIGEFGVSLIEEIAKRKKGKKVNILTHCNAGWLACIDYGTATAPIYSAHKKGIDIHVWVDETRPRNQGARLTAYELGHEGVPHTIIPDNAGGHLMQHDMVDLVLVGSDRTTKTGDVCNKIGTYLKALAAHDNNIPFYVALPSSTIDWELTDGVQQIPIEKRSGQEVSHMEGVVNGEVKEVKIVPENSNVVNYGFDVTPSKYVTGLITEKGVCNANEESIIECLKKG